MEEHTQHHSSNPSKWNTYFLGAITVLLLITTIVSWQTSSNVNELTNTVLGKTQPATQQPGDTQPGTTTQKVNIEAGDSPAKGKKNAPITVVIFSDPSCPFCAAAAGGAEMVSYMKSRSPSWEAAVPNIIKDYINNGKVKLVFKYFPGHGKGQDAMEIMWCANEQGKFWEVHDIMFNNQKLMEAGNTPGLKAAALTVSGLNSAKFEACVAGDKYQAQYNKETQEGQTAGVQGTPAFFINGQLVEGAVPYSQIKAVIEQELSK